MKIFSLYRDFFNFLEKIPSSRDQWSTYFSSYYKLHQEFLENFFSLFPLIGFSSLKQRVEAVKASDYSWLGHLISVCPPEKIIEEAYEKCIKIAPSEKEPEAYIFIGFFSPDGFIMDYREKPVICFGLERYKDFRLLRILFAHEYAHFLMNLSGEEVPEEDRLKWLLISEGIATCFSSLTFPNCALSDHFLFRRDTLNWCQANESYLKEIHSAGTFSTQKLMDLYVMGDSGLGIPPRAGKYLGFQSVKRNTAKNAEEKISLLLSDKKKALSLKI